MVFVCGLVAPRSAGGICQDVGTILDTFERSLCTTKKQVTSCA
jgi:hypothetical protein